MHNDRVATLIVYLEVPQEGGHTIFPYSHANGLEVEYGTDLQRAIERLSEGAS